MGYGIRPTNEQKRRIKELIKSGQKYFFGRGHKPGIAYEWYRICGCGGKECSECNGWGTLPISDHGDYPS